MVTFSALAACTPHATPEPVPEQVAATPTNEPEPEAVTSSEPATVDAAVPELDENPSLASYPNVLNSRDKTGRIIHKAWKDKDCFIELPFPPLLPGQQRFPGTPPPTQSLPCPDAMKEPTYEACLGGVVYQKLDQSACVCFVMGNPPPPPKPMVCPGGTSGTREAQEKALVLRAARACAKQAGAVWKSRLLFADATLQRLPERKAWLVVIPEEHPKGKPAGRDVLVDAKTLACSLAPMD